MYKIRPRRPYPMICIMSGLIAIIFFAGCTNNTTPVIVSSKAVLTQPVPTPSEVLNTIFTAEAAMTESMPHVSPYIKVSVVAVEVRLIDSNPVEVELVIRGTLPDQCKYQFYSIENRVDQTVRVSLDGIHPGDVDCLQTDQNVEYVLRLGRDRTETERGFSRGDYQLTVNNYQTSFSIK